MPASARACHPAALLILVAVLLTGGCSSVRVTDPRRSATEQFLLSQAGQQAIQQLSSEALRDRKVFVDPAFFEAEDEEYVLGELRAHLLVGGVRLVPKREEAQVVLEVRSAGIGIDRYESLLGLPAFVIPQAASTVASGVPNATTLITPEIAIMKTIRQYGFASVAFVAYWADSGELVAASGPYVGRTYRKDFWFLGFGPRTLGNIPPAERIEIPE